MSARLRMLHRLEPMPIPADDVDVYSPKSSTPIAMRNSVPVSCVHTRVH